MKIYHEVRNGQIVPVSAEIENEKEVEFLLDQLRAKGEWSQYDFHDLGGFGDWDYKCSKCSKVNGWKANFCPNCGADMRTKENENG